MGYISHTHHSYPLWQISPIADTTNPPSPKIAPTAADLPSTIQSPTYQKQGGLLARLAAVD